MLTLFFIGSVICIILDQITKYYAYSILRTGSSINILEGIFRLNYCENRGAAFGVMQNKIWLFAIITVLIIGGVIWFMIKRKPKSKLLVVSLTLLTGGALGNFIDRIGRGFVVDFLDFCLINFPIFNVADCFVVIGAILLAIYILFFSPDFPSDKKNKTSEENSEE